MTFRPMPLLTIFTVVGLAILILLGNWQYDRYQEKLRQGPAAVQAFVEVAVDVDRDAGGMAQQVYGIVDGEAVWRRYVPARVAGEDGIVLALVDATSGTAPVPLEVAAVEDFSAMSNVFERPAHKGGMANSNNPEEDTWYSFDGPAMLSRYGVEQSTVKVVEPDRITLRLAEDVSRSRQTQNPYGTAAVRDALPPERHFGYALTWWGLAAALVGVYLAFHHAQGRLRFRGKQ